jgi:tetratricopeptide (TPR) repeat protein
MTRRTLPIAIAALLTLAGATFAQTERDVHDSFNRGNELKKAGKYAEAEQEYQRCFTMALRVYGEEHKNTAVLLHAMGDLYERQGKLDAAEKVYVRGLKIREAINGLDHPDVAADISSLATVLVERHKTEEAEKLLARALKIREKHNGEDSKEVADALNDLAIVASRRGNHEEAEKLYRRSLVIRQKTDGPNSAVVAQSLSNLGLALHDLERYKDAEDSHRRALEIREKVLGKDSPVTAESLNNLAILLRDLGQYPEAEELHRRALKIRETALGVDHFRTASTVSNLAILCMDQGKYVEADGLFRRALATYERVHGQAHPSVADTLTHMANMEKQRGRIPEAERIHRVALSIAEKAYGANHEAVAGKLNNLAALLQERGKNGEAEVLFRRALSIRETSLGLDHNLVAVSLTTLANLVMEMGQSKEAKPLLERALRIREKVFGADHPAVGDAANNLAVALNKIGDRKAAEEMHKRNLIVKEKFFGKEHGAYGDALYSIAEFYREAGRYAEAEEAYRQALPLFERYMGKGHPHVAETMTHIADCLRAQDKLDPARELHQRAKDITQKAYSPEHPTVAVNLNNLAIDACLDGKPTEALPLYDEQRKAARRYIIRDLPFLPEAEQRAFLEQTDAEMLARALTLGRELAKDQEAARKSAEWLVNGKAAALEARTLRPRLDRDNAEPETRQALAEVIDLRAREAALGLREMGPAAANVKKQRTELWVRRRLLEQNISTARTFQPWVDLDAVRQALPAGSVYVDVARFRPARLIKKPDDPAWDEPRYVAWVTTSTGSVTIVDLGEAAPIDAAVRQARQIISTSADRDRELGGTKAERMASESLGRVADQVLKPLQPHLKDAKTLILSPDGELWLVPWAALPYHGETYLVESITPRLVLSGRDLVQPTGDPKVVANAPLIVADPDFNAKLVGGSPTLTGTSATGQLADFEVTFVFGEAGKLAVRVPEGEIIGRGTWTQDGDTIRMETERSKYEGKIVGRELKGQRILKDKKGTPPDSFALKLADNGLRIFANGPPRALPLPLTRPEGEAAATRLKTAMGAEPRLLTDVKATEAAVKSAARPKALVLATHTYFLPPSNEKSKTDDPLSRCGLLLAGYNQRASAEPGQEDGVLTGQEIAGLDLRGTGLVVLPACNTGFGESTTGDSVAGLRQAFQLAGASDVLATLWPIPDTETARLMARFYDRLGSGLGHAEVLAAAQREAIKERRKTMGTAHPYYWAGLTLTGRE